MVPFGDQGRGRATPLFASECAKEVHRGPTEAPLREGAARAPTLGRKTEPAAPLRLFPDGFPDQRRTPTLKGYVGRILVFLLLL